MLKYTVAATAVAATLASAKHGHDAVKVRNSTPDMLFFSMGDWGGASDTQPTTDSEIANGKGMQAVSDHLGLKPRFVMAVGDNFYGVGIQGSEYSSRFQTTFEDVFTEEALECPWYVIAGNHDHKGNVTAQIDYTNDSTPLIVVRKDGAIESLVVLYAMHGTILGPDDLTLTQDSSGALESFVAQGFDSAPVVLMINSWGADMSPGTPDVAAPPEATPLPPGYDKMERIGAYMRDVVVPAVAGATWTSEPDVRAGTYRYSFSRSELGYEFGEFEYLFGAVYCTGGNECVDTSIDEDLDSSCLPFPETAPAPMQSQVTVGALGDAHFVTWAGECTTGLAEQTIAAAQAHEGVDDVLFFGYANDYMGYAVQESDWWYGGYESSGTMWGPKQGDHMGLRTEQAFAHFVAGTELPFTEAEGVPFFDTSEGEPVPVETGLEVGVLAEQPDPAPAAADVVTATVYGSDAWLGAPLATLQVEEGGAFTDVLVGGAPVTSDGYAFWVDLATDPVFTESDVLPMTRHFSWTFSLPVTSRYLALQSGATYRLSIVVPVADSDPMTVETAAFTVQ